MFSCSKDKISHNPFNPNEKIKLKTIINAGFEIEFIEDLACYKKDFDHFDMFFYYDYNKNKVIGEGYYFYIDSVINPSDSIQNLIDDSEFEHDFKIAKPKIDKVFKAFYGKIISPISFLGYTKDLKFYAKDSIYKRIIDCNLIYTTKNQEAIYIENFYPLK